MSTRPWRTKARPAPVVVKRLDGTVIDERPTRTKAENKRNSKRRKRRRQRRRHAEEWTPEVRDQATELDKAWTAATDEPVAVTARVADAPPSERERLRILRLRERAGE